MGAAGNFPIPDWLFPSGSQHAGRGPGQQSRLSEPVGKSYSGSSTLPTDKPKDPMEELRDRIQQLFESLNMPFDPEDPYIKSILSNASTSAISNAQGRGIFGPASIRSGQDAYIRAGAGLQDARQARALQALGMLQGVNQNIYGQQQDKYQNQLDMTKYGQGEASNLGSMIGGGLGAIGGGLLGIPGGPAGIAAGASAGWGAGSGIGAGIGSMFGPKPQPFRPGGY